MKILQFMASEFEYFLAIMNKSGHIHANSPLSKAIFRCQIMGGLLGLFGEEKKPTVANLLTYSI
jgi:hypothetical protein